uniref:Arylacetamide deacetylase like 2 n=1 Tax=Molossus molossus TaxID=27622 RepID=A0A7J8HZ74_MOLMO|nr:arylacetamide deacetylase like 2 [Molossus molossus]
MIGPKVICFGLFCVLFAYQFYTPLPGNIEERWKVMALIAFAKTCTIVNKLTA